MKPADIESLSFNIIESEAKNHNFTYDKWQIVRRMIHTSADFEYLKSVRFSDNAVDLGIKAILNGKTIVTDTQMALSGIRKKEITSLGGMVKCFINDEKVIFNAKKEGITRAKAAADMAATHIKDGIFVVGNAPTALLRILELIKEKKAEPALIIGLPVGFVNAAESKEALISSSFPHISNTGRKGGSNIAASVINALIIMALEKKGE